MHTKRTWKKASRQKTPARCWDWFLQTAKTSPCPTEAGDAFCSMSKKHTRRRSIPGGKTNPENRLCKLSLSTTVRLSFTKNTFLLSEFSLTKPCIFKILCAKCLYVCKNFVKTRIKHAITACFLFLQDLTKTFETVATATVVFAT